MRGREGGRKRERDLQHRRENVRVPGRQGFLPGFRLSAFGFWVSAFGFRARAWGLPVHHFQGSPRCAGRVQSVPSFKVRVLLFGLGRSRSFLSQSWRKQVNGIKLTQEPFLQVPLCTKRFRVLGFGEDLFIVRARGALRMFERVCLHRPLAFHLDDICGGTPNQIMWHIQDRHGLGV